MANTSWYATIYRHTFVMALYQEGRRRTPRDAAGTCQPLRCKGNLRVEIPSLSLSLTLTPSGGKGEL
jgi:hypothetical protein